MTMKPSRAPDFWWRRRSLPGYALAPLGSIYGRIAGRRMAAAGESIGIPVICLGNLVVGGAGKTPTAIEIAGVCRELGYRPGFLSRGYGGSERGPIIVTPAVHTALQIGDEALLLARRAPTVVAADRRAGAKLLAGVGVDVVIMDDGFQNPSVTKDLAIVVVDGSRGTGNGRVFPAGPLRAPLAAQVRRAHAVLVLGTGSGGDIVRLAARAALPILRGSIVPLRRRGLRRRPYLAFAGIAHPEKFFATLEAAGAVVGHRMVFPDHHPFTDVECEAILVQAKARDLVPITTEKDRVRLSGRGGAAELLAQATETFPIRVRFEEPTRLSTLIGDAIARHGSAYRRSEFIATASGAAPAPA
jgi:tetraacyldisaccharide 4'-kinase